VDDERRLMRWEIGDGVLSGGSLGGAAQVLGVTVSREFGIDPYFVRYTPLTLTGAATTASSAEVYVNGQLVAREAIAPGAFTLRGLLAPVGVGQAEVVLRDEFGREQRLTSSFYQPVTLLRPGLHQFRYGVGARRDDERVLLRSGASGAEAYRGFAAVGDHRIGVKEWLTMGGRVEATDRLVGVAPEVALRAPIGELGVTLAGSRDRDAGAGDRGGAARVELLDQHDAGGVWRLQRAVGDAEDDDRIGDVSVHAGREHHRHLEPWQFGDVQSEDDDERRGSVELQPVSRGDVSEHLG
jgi:outer membrane usher protein FimD/PapC